MKKQILCSAVALLLLLAPGIGSAASPEGDYVRLNVRGQTLTMTSGQAEVIKATGGTLTARSTYGYPGLPAGVQLDSDTIYIRYSDGQDELVLFFPIQVQSGSVVDTTTGRIVKLQYTCASALAASDRGVFYSSTNCTDPSLRYVPEIWPIGSSFSITITSISSDKTDCSGTFTGELVSLNGSILPVSGDFNTAIKR